MVARLSQLITVVAGLALSTGCVTTYEAPYVTTCPAEPVPDEASTEPVLPLVEYTEVEFDTLEVLTSIPDDPVGLVFVFHGSGGSTDFVTKVEQTEVLNHLAAAGFGIVATESIGGSDKWDNTNTDIDSNADLSRLQALREHLVDTTPCRSTTPLYGLGMSNGGSFAAVWAIAMQSAGLDVRAIAIHNSAVFGYIGDAGIDVPTIWLASQNDETIGNGNLFARADEQTAAGVDNEVYESCERILRPERFLRIDGVDETEAQAIFDDMVAVGLVDASGQRAVAIEDVDAGVVFATHRFDALWADDEVDFFLEQLP